MSMNGTINDKVESTLAKYIEFRIFELFRNRLVDIIKPHCREDSVEDVYKHLFLCPANLSKKRNFQLRGVLSPFVCLWRTSLLEWNEDQAFYARSVLPRDFSYETTDGKIKCERGFLYDLEVKFELFSSSYYKPFRDRVNQNLIDMDRIRYFDIDIKELLTDCKSLTTRAEVMQTGLQATDNVDNNENRSFDLNASYTVKITVPYCHGFDYIDKIIIYLNENKIYEKEYVEPDKTENPQP